MTVAETLPQKVNQLPLDRQLQVLDFVESLEQEQGRSLARRDPEGLLSDQPSDLSLEDFDQASREAWGNFPREMPR